MTNDRATTPRYHRIAVRIAHWTTLQHLAAVLVPAVVVLLFGGLVYVGLAEQVRGRAQVAHTHHVIENVERVLARLTDAETGQRGYLLTQRGDYLEPYLAAERDARQALDSLRTLVAGRATQISRVDTLARLSAKKFSELDTTIALARTGQRDAALGIVLNDGGKAVMDSARRVGAGMEQSEQRLLATRTAAELRLAKRIRYVLVVGSITAILVALLVNALLSRHAAAQERLVRNLDTANGRLEQQAVELEFQNHQMQEQAVEMEQQQQHLQEQATELEMQSEELTNANDELQTVNTALERAVRDLDQERRIVQDARDAAEHASAAKSEFLATMSHELRTPLNAISGYVDLLAMELRGPVTDAQREDLGRIKKSGQHLLSLINDILNLARIESGRLDLQPSDVRLTEVLSNVEALIAPQMRVKGLLYRDATDGVPYRVHADPEKLQQILLNLLSNACKFTDSGGSVQLTCEPLSGPHGPAVDGRRMVAVRVADTGRGIPNEKLTTIFEPFVQIDRNATHGSQQGVGLGLAISRHLARAMGGDLTVVSVVGVGSTFTLALPLALEAGVALPGQGGEARAGAL